MMFSIIRKSNTKEVVYIRNFRYDIGVAICSSLIANILVIFVNAVVKAIFM